MPVREREIATGAYVTDKLRLFEITEVNQTQVVLQNCKTEYFVKVKRWRLKDDFALVQEAPKAPDFPPDMDDN